MNIFDNIDKIKGIGEKRKQLFNKCGIFNILDLLLYFPRTYEDINYVTENNFLIGKINLINLKVINVHNDNYKNGKIITSIDFRYKNIKITGKWFNEPYIKSKLKTGKNYFIEGKLEVFNENLFIVNGKIINDVENYMFIRPKYNLVSGLNDNMIIKALKEVLNNICIKENLPIEIKHNLKNIN